MYEIKSEKNKRWKGEYIFTIRIGISYNSFGYFNKFFSAFE